jgi:hypothetical protein
MRGYRRGDSPPISARGGTSGLVALLRAIGFGLASGVTPRSGFGFPTDLARIDARLDGRTGL